MSLLNEELQSTISNITLEEKEKVLSVLGLTATVGVETNTVNMIIAYQDKIVEQYNEIKRLQSKIDKLRDNSGRINNESASIPVKKVARHESKYSLEDMINYDIGTMQGLLVLKKVLYNGDYIDGVGIVDYQTRLDLIKEVKQRIMELESSEQEKIYKEREISNSNSELY